MREAAASASAATATGGRNLTAAYDILSTPANALDAAALSQLLAEEGIIAAVDLGAATAEEVQHLAACLRKMPRRRFMEAWPAPATPPVTPPVSPLPTSPLPKPLPPPKPTRK